MKIGITTAVRTQEENWDRLIKFVNSGYKVIEFYNKITRVRTVDVDPLLKLKESKKLDFSFHSMCQDLFCQDKIISMAEYSMLKGEIRLASKLKCDYLIFHITKKSKLTGNEIKLLREISVFAINNNIKLCLENNSSKGVFSTDYLVDILNKIQNLYFCLDIGHYNIALKKRYIKDSFLFLSKVKERLIELHISFNNGIKDQHLGYNKKYYGYFEEIFKKSDGINKRLIIEVKNYKQAQSTRLFLKNYIRSHRYIKN